MSKENQTCYLFQEKYVVAKNKENDDYIYFCRVDSNPLDKEDVNMGFMALNYYYGLENFNSVSDGALTADIIKVEVFENRKIARFTVKSKIISDKDYDIRQSESYKTLRKLVEIRVDNPQDVTTPIIEAGEKVRQLIRDYMAKNK
ncbi:MAG: hypothetical protein ACOXZS_01890 [Bacilli bacterium]|jgi:hypothetical protein